MAYNKSERNNYNRDENGGGLFAIFSRKDDDSKQETISHKEEEAKVEKESKQEQEVETTAPENEGKDSWHTQEAESNENELPSWEEEEEESLFEAMRRVANESKEPIENMVDVQSIRESPFAEEWETEEWNERIANIIFVSLSIVLVFCMTFCSSSH